MESKIFYTNKLVFKRKKEFSSIGCSTQIRAKSLVCFFLKLFIIKLFRKSIFPLQKFQYKKYTFRLFQLSKLCEISHNLLASRDLTKVNKFCLIFSICLIFEHLSTNRYLQLEVQTCVGENTEESLVKNEEFEPWKR